MSSVEPTVPMSEDTKKMIAKWSKQLGLPVADLRQQYIDLLAKTKAQTPGKTNDWYERAARTRVYVSLKSQRFVRAKPQDGIFFGYGPAWDVTSRQRAQALEILRTDPEKAHNEGWVNPNGEPVDMRKTLPSGAKNPFYGRVLKETFIRQSVGIARPALGGDLKFTILQHFRDQALAPKLPPLGKTVRFLANVAADEPDRLMLRTSVRTKYDPITMTEFPVVNTQKICELLLNAPESYRSNLAGLAEWHGEHQDDIRRVVIVEGVVMFLRREPIATTGNYMMFLEDESIMDMQGEGITVWIHSDLKDQLNFGNGSRVIVLGRTVTGPGWNPETRQVDHTVERTMINAMGIWAEPEYLIPVEEERVITSEEGR